MSITCHCSSPVSLSFPKLTIYMAPDVITAVIATSCTRLGLRPSYSLSLCHFVWPLIIFHCSVSHCTPQVTTSSSSPLYHWLITPHTTLSVTLHTSRLDTPLTMLNLCALHHSQCSLLIHLTVLHYSLHSDITSDCITHAHNNIFMWASTQALHTFTVNPLLDKTLSTAFTFHCFIVSTDMSKCLNMHVTIITPHSWLQRYP